MHHLCLQILPHTSFKYVYKKNAKKRENEPARIEWNGGQMHRVCLQILLHEALKYVCQKNAKKKWRENGPLRNQ